MARLEIDLFPTEDSKKVIAAVKNIFPSAKLHIGENKITGETDVKKFDEIITLTAVRKTVEDELEKNNGYIDLSKMAAAAGKVSIDEDFPLGKIRLIFG